MAERLAHLHDAHNGSVYLMEAVLQHLLVGLLAVLIAVTAGDNLNCVPLSTCADAMEVGLVAIVRHNVKPGTHCICRLLILTRKSREV